MNIMVLMVRANFHGSATHITPKGRLIKVDHPFGPPSSRKRTFRIDGRETTEMECAQLLFDEEQQEMLTEIQTCRVTSVSREGKPSTKQFPLTKKGKRDALGLYSQMKASKDYLFIALFEEGRIIRAHKAEC